MPPEEVTLRTYMDAMLASAKADRDSIRASSEASLSRILVAIDKLDFALEKQVSALDTRIKAVEQVQAEFRGRLWMMGAALGTVILLANLATPWVANLIP